MKPINGLLRVGLAVFLLWMSAPAAPVQADAGPKPNMTFAFEFDAVEAQSILGGEQWECGQSDCSDGAPLRVAGPQRFTCTPTECSSTAYGYKEYHKLIIQFADRTRESNVFVKRGYNAHFRAIVRADDLLIIEDTLFDPIGACNGVVGTLVIEVLVAAAYLSIFKLPRLLVGWAALGSLLTLPFVWLAFPLLPLPPLGSTALAEGFATLAEAGLFYLAAGRTLSFRTVLLVSLATNGASFAFGLFL